MSARRLCLGAVFCLATLLISMSAAGRGRIDPELLDLDPRPDRVDVIIWLKHQPAFEIAQPIRVRVDQV